MELVGLLIVVAGLSCIVGMGLGAWAQRVDRYEGIDPSPAPGRGDRSPHIHRFDTMEADGLGWKCGICRKAKGAK